MRNAVALLALTAAALVGSATAASAEDEAPPPVTAGFAWTGGAETISLSGQTLTGFGLGATSDTCGAGVLSPTQVVIEFCTATLSVRMTGSGTTCSGGGVGTLNVSAPGFALSYIATVEMTAGAGTYQLVGATLPVLRTGTGGGFINVNCVERVGIAWGGSAVGVSTG